MLGSKKKNIGIADENLEIWFAHISHQEKGTVWNTGGYRKWLEAI